MKPRVAGDADRQWYIVTRWHEFAGETRANLLRVMAIAVFYSIQLWIYHGQAELSDATVAFHRAATAVAVCWTAVALANLLCLQQRIFPRWLKYVSTLADVVLLTMLAALGGGAHSPLIHAYFLIIVLAGMRFSLRLIWCATAACLVGYLILIALHDPYWFPRVKLAITVRPEQR
ncbi:MAG: hypothetical protein KDA55_18425, partial [Planctomycetales bacterium]|nr:hypothetical protein [Planctomycetales bacterium]